MGIKSRISAIAVASALSLTAAFNAYAQEAPAPEATPQEQSQQENAPSYDMTELQKLVDIAPATITDKSVLNANFMQIIQNIDLYYTAPQTYENKSDDFDAMESPFIIQSTEQIKNYIAHGADINYVDAKTNASAFAWALWLAYEMDKPEIVQLFIENDADVHMRLPANTPIPQAEQNAYNMLFKGRPETENKGISILDHAAIALMESQALNTSPLSQNASLNHVRTAANITAQILNEGAVWSDVLQLPKTITTVSGEIPVNFDTINDLVTSYSAANVFYEEGLINTEQRRTHIYGSSELRDKAMNLTEITDQSLKDIGANIVKYPDVPPGGPEPYTVENGDTVWEIAGRFAPFMGNGVKTQEDAFWAMAELNNMTVLPRNKVMRVDENGGTTIGIKEGETILIPVDPTLQIGKASAPVEIATVVDLLTQHIIDIAKIQPQEASTKFPQIIKDLADANGVDTENLGPILRVNKKIIMPQIDGIDHPPITFTIEDVIREFAEKYKDNFYIENATPDQVFNTITQINGLDSIILCRPETLQEDGTCPMIWMPYINDTYEHYDRLIPPSDIDPERRVDLFVVETESYHQKMATRAAAGTNYALNPDVDYSQFHVLVDPVWGAHVKITGRMVSEGLQILQHPDNALKDNIIYTSSMHSYAVGKERDKAPIINDTNAQHIRNARHADHAQFENIRANLERMEKANPILFQAIGNEFPHDGDWAFDINDLHSGRVVMAGAVGNYRTRAGETHTMAPYTGVGADMCFQLPQELGRQNEGTSFATPTGSAVYRQKSEWYGHRLTFEEIMAAGMMTASQDIPELMHTPFGPAVKASDFRTNGAGMAFNYRCGAGEIDPEIWNETLKEMVQLKAGLDNPGENFTDFIDIGDAVEIETLEDGDTIYTYHITAPRDLTLTKQTLLLPQESGAHSEVVVRMPSGFEYHLPKSLTDVVSTSAFNYEDIKEGDTIEIKTGEPLAETAMMVLRGVEDGNAIQALRDVLQDRGILYEPLMSVSSNGTITKDAGIDIDLTPPLPKLPGEEEKPTPNLHP